MRERGQVRVRVASASTHLQLCQFLVPGEETEAAALGFQ